MTFLSVILAFFFVSFTDKGNNPQVALSSEALALRTQRGIAIDSLDYGVCPMYVDSLRKVGATVYHTSRWLNGATVELDQTAYEKINKMSFVKALDLTSGIEEYVEWLNTQEVGLRKKVKRDKSESIYRAPFEGEEPEWEAQLKAYNLLPLHEAGFKGQGVTIAVIDGGFQNINTFVAFDSIRNSGRLLGQLNFATDDDAFDGPSGEHGSVCMALIAGDMENYQGAANQARFYAIKSEENETERPVEADNLVAAIEASDSIGAWIASISLGYALFDETPFDYKYSQLDGYTLRASRAAHIAARKGMLLCIAAGNSGTKANWPWISSPADADSILTVGAVGLDSIAADFSSIGPAADGRIKPDVCAVGKGACVISPKNETVYYGNGTSFATPLVAGLAACLWSALPAETNRTLCDE